MKNIFDKSEIKGLSEQSGSAILERIRSFLLSKTFFIILIILGYAVSFSGSLITEVHYPLLDDPGVTLPHIIGVVFFILLICAILVISDDIQAIFCPLLVLCVFACDCYNSFDVFVRFWWLAIPAAAAVAFHFIYYRTPLCIGKSIWGIAAAGGAILLGGIGTISAKDYFAPITLYYTLALSFGMILAHIILRSHLARPVKYDRFEKLAEIMYAIGIFVCIELFWNYLIKFNIIITTWDLSVIQQKNNYSTFLLFCLPYPLYFARKKRLHILSELLMLFCIFMSGSRGGMVSAVVLVPFLLAYLSLAPGEKARRFGRFTAMGAVAVLGIVAVCVIIFILLLERTGVISHEEQRYLMIRRAIDAFKENPIFGAGLGNTANTDIYLPKKGAFYWYHSLPLQLMGSLGIVGIAAYSYQAMGRMLQISRRLSPATAALGLSYLGILIMSCFNPGEFVPLPYELMVVTIFVMVELHSGEEAVYSKR